MFDGKAFGAEVAALVRSYVDQVFATFRQEIDGLKAAFAATPRLTTADVERLVAEALDAREEDSLLILNGPVSAAQLAHIREVVAAATEDLRLQIEHLEHRPDIAEVDARIASAIAGAPPPAPGKGLTVEDVAPLIAAEVAKAIAAMPAPKDPIGVAGALIDREGDLVLTLSDGTPRPLGRVVGRDVDMIAVARMIAEEVAKIPPPRDGKDGFDLRAFDVERPDERTIVFKFEDGERSARYELRLAHVLDCGVYREGEVYSAGDGVTWGGSFWIAQRETTAKPETDDSWRLAVKKGRDGKPGEKGDKGEPGKKGDPGVDRRF